MRTPDEIRERLLVRWRRQWTAWLGGGGEWPVRFALDPPDEATARAEWSRFATWLALWREPPFGAVDRATRRWPALGTQDVPTHVQFNDAHELALALGAPAAQLYDTAQERWRERAAAWPQATETLRKIGEWLGSASDVDYARFTAVIDWLMAHPGSGLRLRQLPIPGVHSKWVEANTSPLGQVLAALRGVAPGQAFTELAGLTVDPPRRRFRLLDPQLRACLGGVSDISLGLPELAGLKLPVRAVLIVENLQTALAFGDLPGVLLFVGGGFAISETRELTWMASVPIHYWGDIDNAGFAILHTLRSHHPHAQSLLMDEATLLRHRDLWTHDDSKPGAALDLLTGEERALYAKLGAGAWGPAVRLEQERIDWAFAITQIQEALQLEVGGDAITSSRTLRGERVE